MRKTDFSPLSNPNISCGNIQPLCLAMYTIFHCKEYFSFIISLYLLNVISYSRFVPLPPPHQTKQAQILQLTGCAQKALGYLSSPLLGSFQFLKIPLDLESPGRVGASPAPSEGSSVPCRGMCCEPCSMRLGNGHSPSCIVCFQGRHCFYTYLQNMWPGGSDLG